MNFRPFARVKLNDCPFASNFFDKTFLLVKAIKVFVQNLFRFILSYDVIVREKCQEKFTGTSKNIKTEPLTTIPRQIHRCLSVSSFLETDLIATLAILTAFDSSPTMVHFFFFSIGTSPVLSVSSTSLSVFIKRYLSRNSKPKSTG